MEKEVKLDYYLFEAKSAIGEAGKTKIRAF